MRSSLLVILALLGGCIEYEPTIGVEPNDTVEEFPPGMVPDIQLTPEGVPFGNWTTECPSSPRTITVRNVGDEGSTLEISDIELADGVTAFGLEAQPTASLGVADRLEFTVWFQPPTDDAFTGIVRVSSNDPDQPEADADLSGEGAGSPPFEVMDRFEQNLPNEVDVLFVIDNSCSMADEQATLGNSFATFMDSFYAMGIDFHLAVTSTAMETDGTYDPPLMGKFAGAPTILDASMDEATLVNDFRALASLGANGTGNEKGLDAAYAALTAPLINGYNAGFLRPAANLAVVVLSDEPDASNKQPGEFSAWLDSMKPDEEMSSLSTITGTVESSKLLDIQYCDPDHKLTSNSTQYGEEYIEAADATGGTVRDICETDWNSLVKFLSYSAAGLATEFDLSEEPAGIGSITVLVDGAEVDYDLQNGWSYDPAENSIVFNGNSMPGPDQDVVVTYDVDSADACN